MFSVVFVAFLLSWAPAAANAQCTTIQDGTLLNSANEIITTGYDEWGYNYQSRIFNGGYCDSYRDAAWCQPYKDVDLLMKWDAPHGSITRTVTTTTYSTVTLGTLPTSAPARG